MAVPPIARQTSFTAEHHFAATGPIEVDDIADSSLLPLSVIVQVTRRCNFHCAFCSETAPARDPTIEDLAAIAGNLRGVPRVFLSGGEPLLRGDFLEVADLFTGFVVGLPTNATRETTRFADLVGRVAFANVGLDGPRSVTGRVRGDYDAIMRGIEGLRAAGIPLSLSAVVLRSTLGGLPFTYQIADAIGAGKLKLILPVRKGNALSLDRDEFIDADEADAVFEELARLRDEYGWSPALRMTTWTALTEGHMIVVEPDGTANAWPVLDAPDLFERLGNLKDASMAELWPRYRFKRNHYAKYLGQSIRCLPGHPAAVGSRTG